MEEPKRGPGRPRKLPDGTPKNIRCVLFNGEHARLSDALAASGMSQADFTRAAVLHCADVVNGMSPPHPKPKRSKS